MYQPPLLSREIPGRVQLKCDGTRWRTGGELKRKLAEWVASTLHTTSEHGVSSITTADAHTSAASSRLNWRPPADLNGIVRFAERENLVSARVPSHFKRSLLISFRRWVDPRTIVNEFHSTLHARHSSIQNNKYQVSQKQSCFSWWWAHICPKHVEKRNKHTKKNCAPGWLYLQDNKQSHWPDRESNSWPSGL